ncbi:uncharacterized protein LOC143833921 isoform X1 [Paroedura picta]|uniref:uncharacterized protein LOC143833921 isoform X1 n=1 Tax=Paroedura picta TaxID=143630 RepID=UPI004055BBE0
MATGHGGGSAQHAHSDGEQEPGAKRLKMDPACHVAQAGGLEKVGEGLPLEGVKQEPGEEPWQGAEAQRQPFPKVVEIFSSERGSSGDQGRAGGLQPPLEATPEPRGYKIPLLLSGSAQKPQSPPVGQGKTVYKIVKAGFTGEVGREEVILGDDLSSWDAERRRFRDFCYYEAVGPRLTSVRLWTLCRQWLRPEKRTKEQILEQVILEQFLAILPPEMQSWVKAHHPNSCPRAVALAEGFLLIQEQKAQEALQKEAAGIPKTEEPPLESCQRPFASMEIKQENDGDPKPGAGTLPVVKEEDLSQEDPLMEPPATAAGRAQGSVPSPREPKEEPGTTCNPGDGIGRKIKEEDLSEEESPMEVAASAEEGPQQNVSFPSGSALVGLPEEEPGATWNPGDGTVSEIKVEVLSEEDALAEEPETAAGGAQPSSAFPSGSSTVRLPKEPGTACNPELDSSASNPGPKQKRRSYEAGFKLMVVSRAEESNNSVASKEFCVDEKQVREWRRMKAALEKIPKAKKARRGSTTSYGALETELYKWIMECLQNGYCVTRMGIRLRALQMAKEDTLQAPGIENFVASAGWCTRFMNRFALCLRQRRRISLKMPKDLDEKVLSFHSFVVEQRRTHNYDLGDIGTMDETPMTLDLPSDRAVARLGDRTAGNEKNHFTVVLSCLANGTKLRPVVIFKRKALPKKVQFPPRITVRAHAKGWMNEKGTKKWLEEIWNGRPGAGSKKKPSLLVWDMFRAHTSEAVKKLAKSSQVTLAAIPGGLAPVLQPLEVRLNKAFKDRVRARWREWASSGQARLTKLGNPVKPDLGVIARWIRDAWEEIPEDTVRCAFKKCGIGSSADGGEDGALYGGDGSDGEDCELSDDDNVYAGNLTPAAAEALFGQTEVEEESSSKGL